VKELIIVTFLFINGLIFAQPTFHKGYDIGNNSLGFGEAKLTLDGNYIVGGTASYSTGERICLAKINNNGDTLWTKTYGGNDRFAFTALDVASDSGFIVLGTLISPPYNPDIIVLKTDSKGNILWLKNFSGPKSDIGNHILQTKNGDYIITGYSNSFSGSDLDLIVCRIDQSGTLLWTRFFNGMDLRGNGIENTMDDGIVITGEIYDSVHNSRKDVFIIKLNEGGNFKWMKAYDGPYGNDDYGAKIKQTSDKGFIVSGTTFVPIGLSGRINRIYLLKTDSLGNLLWSKKFGGNGNDGSSAIAVTRDGGFSICGSSTSFVGNNLYMDNGFVIKTDSLGLFKWCKYYGANANSQDNNISISVTNDKGFLVAGNSAGNGYLFKSDSLGVLQCNEFGWQLYDSVYTSSFYSPSPVQVNHNFTLATPTVNVSHLSATIIDPCTVGVEEIEHSNGLIIFPNPNNGIFWIQSDVQNEISIKVCNCLGMEILNTRFREKISLDISKYGLGMYYIKIIDVRNLKQEFIKVLVQ
jgi:hypothetical protein